MKQGIIGIVVLVGLLICMVIQPVMAETAEELFVKGQDLADQGKYSQAIQYYDQALAITQTNDQIYYFKGNALLYLKKYQEAIDAYNAALAINSQNTAAQHNLNTAKTQMAQTVTPTSTSTPSASWQQKYQDAQDQKKVHDAQDQKKVHDALSPVSPLVVFGALGLLVLFRRVGKA